jgi:hypothetical protein
MNFNFARRGFLYLVLAGFFFLSGLLVTLLWDLTTIIHK